MGGGQSLGRRHTLGRRQTVRRRAMRERFGFYWDCRRQILKKVDCVWRADLGGGGG